MCYGHQQPYRQQVGAVHEGQDALGVALPPGAGLAARVNIGSRAIFLCSPITTSSHNAQRQHARSRNLDHLLERGPPWLSAEMPSSGKAVLFPTL